MKFGTPYAKPNWYHGDWTEVEKQVMKAAVYATLYGGGGGRSRYEDEIKRRFERNMKEMSNPAIGRLPWFSCEASVMPQSQKIKGLLALHTEFHRLSVHGHGNNTLPERWFWGRAKDVLEHVRKNADLPCEVLHMMYEKRLFVRPCPMRPRHGFVDSRLCNSVEEIRAVAMETFKAEDDGEMLFVRFTKPEFSAILTENMFAFGQGHDGATGGKAKVVFGPNVKKSWVNKINRAASVAGDSTFFMEMVEQNGYLKAVQVRGGPPISTATDYVPKPVTVTNVIVAHEDTDLMKWEKLIEEAKDGDIVYAPGMSLASHFCVHAVVNSVPCITSWRPKVGDKIEKIDTPEFSAGDYKRMADAMGEADAIMASAAVDRSRLKNLGFIGLAALHSAGTPAPGTDEQVRFMAYGAVSAAKLIAAACYGEMRHTYNTKCGAGNDGRSNAVHNAWKVAREELSGSCRQWNFSKALHADTQLLADSMYAIATAYRERSWGGSFGGPAWAKIAVSAGAMLRAINEFRASPSKETWARIVSPWNKAVNAEHNGGDGALGKFGVGKGYFELAANNPLGMLAVVKVSILAGTIFGLTANTYKSTKLRGRKDRASFANKRKRVTTRRVTAVASKAPKFLGSGADMRLYDFNSGKQLGTTPVSASFLKKYETDAMQELKVKSGSKQGQVAIVLMASEEKPPVGGTKFIQSVRSVETILTLDSMDIYEPHEFVSESIVNIHFPVMSEIVEVKNGIGSSASSKAE